ncbi:MAG: cobalamin-dependent protein [Dehalococcoidia bacterium]
MATETKVKVITAKIGTDDHYRGITAVTQALRDAGMEVVFLGTGQRVDSVIATAAQEDAQVIGLSFLCGGHLPVMRRFMNALSEQGLGSIPVVVGGTIPPQDVPRLKELGVAGVFIPGTSLSEITGFVRSIARGTG